MMLVVTSSRLSCHFFRPTDKGREGEEEEAERKEGGGGREGKGRRR